MAKPRSDTAIERARRAPRWYPWVFIALGVVSLGGAAARGGLGSFTGLIGVLWLVLGIALMMNTWWTRTQQKRRNVPAPELVGGEVVLWSEIADDRQARFNRAGGLTLTNKRLAFEPKEDRYDPAVGHEWPVELVGAVTIEPIRLVGGEHINSGTLVFDLGDEGVQRFEVFDAESAVAEITAKLDELKGARS